jgi:hypothetical protein
LLLKPYYVRKCLGFFGRRKKLARKIVSGIILTVIVLGTSMLVSNAFVARASGPVWDLNGDGVVNGEDLIIVAKAFGSYGSNFLYQGSPASPRWNAICDFNGDGQVNGLDLLLLAKHFGQTAS